jgi:long-chain acyl-CoA synthetase
VPAGPGPPAPTLAGILSRSHDRYADRLAVLDGPERLTYRELGERARRFASGLRRLDIAPGARIVLLSGNRAEFLVVDSALFVGGYVRVAPSNRLHPREVAHIAADCAAAVLVVEPDWLPAAQELRGGLPAMRHVVVLPGDGAPPPGVTGYDAVLGLGADEPSPAPRPEDPAALLYTSGTTGAPKGATLSHGNWVAMIRNCLAEIPRPDERDVVLHVAPLSHLSGYLAPVFLAYGAAHAVLRRFDPVETLRAVEDLGVSVLPLVPTVLNRLLEPLETGRYRTSSVRLVPYAGSAIAPDRLWRAVRALGPVLVQFYGLSETPIPVTALSQADHRLGPGEEAAAPARFASAGRATPFYEVELRGPDGTAVPAGDVGEITVRGDAVMTGYWGRPGQTAEMIDGDGWAATGDLGRFDPDGYLHVVDRKKDMVVTGGYNVYPTELENVISALPGVAEVAVVGAPDEEWGEAVTAVVARRPGAAVTADDVVTACRGALAGYKRPRRVMFVDELPKTGSGKILRRTLRDQLWAGRDRRVGG